MLIKENEVKRTRGLTDGVPPQEAASRHYAWPGSQDKANSAGDQRRSEAYPARQLPAARSEKREPAQIPSPTSLKSHQPSQDSATQMALTNKREFPEPHCLYYY